MNIAGTGGGDAAGSGGDGLGGGENAGSLAPAGAGGAGGMAAAGSGGAGGIGGTGGGGGTGGSVAGTGGVGGAGAGGAGAGGMAAAGSGGAGGGCPTMYTAASHVMMNVSWDATTGVNEGSGVVHIWTKTKFDETGTPATAESISCGSVLPEITTIPLLGSKKILPEIPNEAWDNAAMPKFVGTVTKNGSMATIDPGVALLGLTMADPSAAWPARTAVTQFDHDGDSNPGVTAFPRDSADYMAPPVKLSLNGPYADKLYLATRNVMTLTSTMSSMCPQTWSGTANVTKFDNHVIGCHVKGEDRACTDTEAEFVDNNRTAYIPGSATFTAKIVADDATCADVRAALPMN